MSLISVYPIEVYVGKEFGNGEDYLRNSLKFEFLLGAVHKLRHPTSDSFYRPLLSQSLATLAQSFKVLPAMMTNKTEI